MNRFKSQQNSQQFETRVTEYLVSYYSIKFCYNEFAFIALNLILINMFVYEHVLYITWMDTQNMQID